MENIYASQCVQIRFIFQCEEIIWTASSEFGTYRICEQRRFRRACASAQSRQNLRCSLIQALSQEEPSDRKPDPWPLRMAGHAQLKFVVTECSKTQIRLTGFICSLPLHDVSATVHVMGFQLNTSCLKISLLALPKLQLKGEHYESWTINKATSLTNSQEAGMQHYDLSRCDVVDTKMCSCSIISKKPTNEK